MITAGALLVLFGLYWGGKFVLKTTLDGGLGGGKSKVAADSEKDSDGDGVADFYEVTFYNSDPNNPDTDGDGVDDLTEITTGRDPLTPGPEDIVKPPTGKQVAVQTTYTQKYLASLPIDVPREQILDQGQLENYVNANKGELLPLIKEGTIKITPAEGAEAIKGYLDIVSSTSNTKLAPVTSADLEAAFRLQVSSANSEPMIKIAEALRNNVEILEAVEVPAEAAAFHTKLLAASMSLRDNANLLRDVNKDFVGGLIGAKNIEELGLVWQELAAEINNLEVKYGLE